MTPPYRSALLVAPSLLIFIGLFIAPTLYFLLVSFWRFESYELIREFNLDNYREVAADYLRLGIYTLVIAGIISLLAVTLGFVYAYVARFNAGRFGSVMLFVALISLFGGYLMKVYAWRTILGMEGIINNALLASGIVSEPVTWLLYNPPSVVLTLTNFLFPFAMLPIFASMQSIQDSELESARDLGAPWTAILFDHVVPRCKTGIVTGFALCFLISCGDWVTPVLVGGRMTMLGNLIAAQFGEFLNWPLGAAMSFSLLAAAFLVVLAFSQLMRIFDAR
ncbi:MAG TPA: ABC transporter permease [Aestuariivirgaceae bacterium]|jgi:spermidine/putrescine transport system permease protein|nr:ABC transporter permease [Aestuariivirgaceae bacterium]